jgi:hypothetical protein
MHFAADDQIRVSGEELPAAGQSHRKTDVVTALASEPRLRSPPRRAKAAMSNVNGV